ncbi:Nucleoside-diphosphate-sugar epimerase [Halovenus aranensis]|uniref:Nucleoside-diphosphate-sugar epimerase n=1 Tax=Halovenus aranensis TaxID=890420 RepID=A0A1G8X5J3_9EURY|nr:NAD(P)-dependent oxidoreductase [Halovenus aranensis]SDJ85882.1 Nucleoside-diphosphate-sugar epimerase [Halovenus aranensis]
METVLVTGALGTLGRWTVAELADEYDVLGVDRHEPHGESPEGVEYLAADLTEQGPIWEIIHDVEPDGVVHLAAVPGAGHRAGTETFVHNVTSTYNVLTAAGEVGADVVWSSSEATYGVTAGEEARPLASLPVDETHPQRPEDAYGTSKVVGELVAERTVRTYGVSVTSLQPSWIQVPGEYETAAIREGFDIENPTPSGSLWSYVDVRDVARLVGRALAAETTGHESYIAVAEDNYVDEPTAEAVAAAWGDRAPECDIEGDRAAFSTAKAKRDLGWEPRHSWHTAETESVASPLEADR